MSRRYGDEVRLPLNSFSFMGTRRLWFALSGTLLLIGIVSLLFQGLNLGVDFTGGSVLELAYQDPVTPAAVEEVLAGYPETQGAQVQRLGSSESPTIRIRARDLPSGGDREAMYAALAELGSFEIALLDEVSPAIGRELTRAGLLAVGVAILGMITYITLRFEFRFAACAIAALLHDSVITLGLFSLLRMEIDGAFIAAVLTIVGYSVNDTIVVFDRIRENLRYRKRGEDLAFTVDRSIRQTLMRSLATSVTTFVAVGSIWAFGGATIRSFTAALLLGIVVGTYSSIFLASPLWIAWQDWRPAKTVSRA
ncbi:MAG: protein translocase subunit SecF [Bacillota bacterium]